MSVGKRVLERLVVAVVDAVELLGHVSVSPLVVGQFCHITVIGIAPFGRSLAAALYFEFHRRHILRASVGIEHHVEQVGFWQRRRKCYRIYFFR